jgi:hypothetical protein
MKISDLLSPADVMIDINVSDKRRVSQKLATKAAVRPGLPQTKSRPTQAGIARIKR